MSFPHYMQLDQMDCGPSCLRMIAKYYSRSFSLQYLRERCFLTREGVSFLGISDAAESIGFRTQGVRMNLQQLAASAPLPCILHWKQNHFVVCYKIKRSQRKGNVRYRFSISDPASGRAVFEQEEFEQCWLNDANGNGQRGLALLLYPTPALYDQEDAFPKEKEKRLGLGYFLRYLTPHRHALFQLMLIMGAVTLLQLLFPFLSQSIVDKGIGNKDIGFITLILIAQVVLFFTQMAIEFLRSWIVLHMTTRINISLISDYLSKLMRLPMKYFDTKMIGDIMQRIGDHGRIQSFLTGSSLSVLFSLANFLIFGVILAYYNITILGVFLLGNAFYICWVLAFMHYRRQLDQRRFTQSSADQSNMIELITGMQEIKLNNCEQQKRWKWERIQVKLFKISMKGLALGQYQQVGSSLFSQVTNLIISYLAAVAVVEGHMTLGMMMSVSYLTGQLSAPISQFIGLAQSFQDAKISLERLSEVHERKNEVENIESMLTELPENRAIQLDNVWFSYDGADRDYALEGIDLVIPAGKTTAIVGASGSGKTTLVKLMLGFYTPNKGKILVGATPLQNIHPRVWRMNVGVVMQEGFIFSDTIAANIAVGEEYIDKHRLYEAVDMANIKSYIDGLPLTYSTKIGMEGKGLSQGQKQRLIIARAIYKQPAFLFFDEATNALDATNEHQIIENLKAFNQGRTVVIVAHRLSTVQHADNIVVMEQGRIVEQGTHAELTAQKGAYYALIKNQLELGS